MLVIAASLFLNMLEKWTDARIAERKPFGKPAMKKSKNTLNIKKLIRNIKKVKKYCIKNNINLGIEGMYADISEVSGYDYSKKTIEMMSELIDELI